jgi:hypothetical protein
MNCANYNELKWGLEELANKEEQLRLWCNVGNESGEISSLTEASCSVFNFDVDRILEGKQAAFTLTEEVTSLLTELRNQLKQVASERSAREQVEDPAMETARMMSRNILKKLNYGKRG